MRNSAILLGSVAITVLLMTTDGFARGGGGGGGGAGRGGGGFSGGARPAASPSINRSPSMSRAAAPAPRPSAGVGQGMGANRPAQLPATNRAAAGVGPAVSGRAAIQSPQSYQRPSQSQVSNFLSLPQQPNGRVSSPPAPNLTSNDGQGPHTKTITTPGGSTITVAGGSGSHTTEGGTTIGGAGVGVKVEGAGGNTYVKGSGVAGAKNGDNAAIAAGSRTGIETAAGGEAVHGSGIRAATDGTNSAVRAGSFTTARDASGDAMVHARGGYADSSGYRQGGSLTAARNQWGYTGVRAVGGYGVDGTGQVGAIAGIRGPGGNIVSAGRGATFVNGQFVGGQAWTAVNGAYTRWNVFRPDWYVRYPGAWWPGKWAIATTAWATATWAVAGSYCSCTDEGAYYDYGGNVTYEEDTVYYGDQPVASAEQYYDQASQIADAGQTTQNEEWLPLGVFSVIAEPTQTQSDKVVQLAVNKDGVIRGNLQDSLSDKVLPIVGAVDKDTQRVALKAEGNDSIVVETGLYNLTNDEVPVLVHFGADRQELRTLIRLKQPDGQVQP